MTLETTLLAGAIASALTAVRQRAALARGIELVRDGCKAARILAHDNRVPRWLKVMLVFGLSPLPGPVDDVILPIAVAILIVRHRDVVREAWQAVCDAR